jgi:hypothetical protein
MGCYVQKRKILLQNCAMDKDVAVMEEMLKAAQKYRKQQTDQQRRQNLYAKK